LQKARDLFYYITLQNENYPHPEMPQGAEEGIGRGLYLLRQGQGEGPVVQLMGSGSILREVLAAADLLAEDFQVQADVWSILGVNQLHREGLLAEDWNRYHPQEQPRRTYLETTLEGCEGPVIISTDYVRAYPEQLRRFIPRPLTTLGTDGFGRSDSRPVLRRFFRVDRYHVVLAALQSLADQGTLSPDQVTVALEKYALDGDSPSAVCS
jgi:pyruvate dehydrogenase E1 component